MGGSSSKADWTAVNMKGKTAIVTGANSGIGYETAKYLALMGAKVIIACRSENKAKAAMLRMQADYLELQPDSPDAGNTQVSISETYSMENQNTTNHNEATETNQDSATPEANDGSSIAADSDTGSSMGDGQGLDIEFMKLDLTSLSSVMSFSNAFKAKQYSLHVLVCNAGIAFVPLEKTQDGFEKHFQVNYLSHFLLILNLLPIMRTSGDDCRIVNVSSVAHEEGKLDLNNIQGQKSYDRISFYGNSKLFQIMMMYSLERRLQNSNVGVYCIHPGIINTNITNNFQDYGLMKNLMKLGTALGKVHSDMKRGAATSIMVSVSPHMKELRGYYFAEGVAATPTGTARNLKKQEVLWQYTLECLKDYIQPPMVQGLELSDNDKQEIDALMNKK